MTSLTIHDLDDSVARLLRQRAKAEGLSLNRTIKRLLEEALGVKPRPGKHRSDFEKLCGTWSRAELDEFERVTAAQRKVDPRDWR